MDSPDILEIWLQSVTVFWEDLGLPPRRKMVRHHEDILADFWDESVQPWINENVKGVCNPHEAGVWFADRKDAMLFKLVWNGNFPDE